MSTSKEETLDKIISKYIRLRDSDEYGMIRCISCESRVKWNQADCGHYIPRGNMSLRFDPKNMQAQCVNCNRFLNGNHDQHKAGIIRRFGIVHLNYLEEKKNEIKQWSEFELDLLILHYKKLVKGRE